MRSLLAARSTPLRLYVLGDAPGLEAFRQVWREHGEALGLTDAGTLTPLLTAKLAPEWASFPTLAGRSFYGQPVKKYSRLRSFYELNLVELRRLRDQRREQLSQELRSDVCTGSRIDCATTF